jgi:AraC-like DNA-binding protein
VHPFYGLFPPYEEVERLSVPAQIPSTPHPPRGSALIWNLEVGDWGGQFRRVRDRPPGVALFVLLPSTGDMGDMDRLLDLMEHCRPHSLLPHMSEVKPKELVFYLKRFPSDLPLEVSDYLAWRGIEVDSDTRRLIRKILELSDELRTVSGLARSLYMSRRALGRRFTTRGIPVPSHWLHFGRILRAALRLQNPEATLHSIACDLGYPDGFSLSNQMHRLTGLRPSLMRECFGWEWIVEAWLLKEAQEGHLAPDVRRNLFPDRSLNPTHGSAGFGNERTFPGDRAKIAERPRNSRRSLRSS